MPQVSSIFSQFLHLVIQPLIEEVVRRQGDCHARGLRRWHRPWEMDHGLFLAPLNDLRTKLPTHAKPPLLASGKLYRLDSTVIDLCAKVFDWAKYRTTKGTVKIHLLLDHDGLLPTVITAGNEMRLDAYP